MIAAPRSSSRAASETRIAEPEVLVRKYGDDYFAELDSEVTIDALAWAIGNAGHEVLIVSADTVDGLPPAEVREELERKYDHEEMRRFNERLLQTEKLAAVGQLAAGQEAERVRRPPSHPGREHRQEEGHQRGPLACRQPQRLQFAAGATKVRAAHLDSPYYASWAEAKKSIGELPLKKFRTSLFTAHLMGGCGMSQNARRGVVDSRGRHHQLANLSVMDGSVFPTSIGANPQLSIYALTAQNATALAKTLTG